MPGRFQALYGLGELRRTRSEPAQASSLHQADVVFPRYIDTTFVSHFSIIGMAGETLDLFDIRRENLLRVVAETFDGNKAAMARAAGVNPNQVNLVLSSNPQIRRNLGETLARRIEGHLGLRKNQLDEAIGSMGPSARLVASVDLVPRLGSVLRKTVLLDSVHANDRALRMLDSHIGDLDHLWLAEIATAEMAPELSVGDCVLVQTGVSDVAVDGIYVLAKGEQVFLRRVHRQLSGGLLVSTGLTMGEQVHLTDLNDFQVLARIPLVIGIRRL